MTLAKGDRFATLSGQRLDEIAGVEIGDVRLSPDGLTREGDTDRLVVTAADGRQPMGSSAKIRLTDGRTLSVPITAAPPRPAATLIARSLTPKAAAGAVTLATKDETILPDNNRLTFSVRAADGTRLAPTDAIEVGTADGSASVTLEGGRDVRLSSPDIAVATLDPARLGPAAAGPLRYRIVRGAINGDWSPLATLVRLPGIDAMTCAADGCQMTGRDLFLIDRVAANADMTGRSAFRRGSRRRG